MGLDREGRRVYILLHGGYYQAIQNMVASLPGGGELMELDSLYTTKMKAGLLVKPFFKTLGERLVHEGIEESMILLKERIGGKRGS